MLELLPEIGIGLVVGTLVGLTGIGGGALMTPALVILLHKPVLVAIGIDFVFVTVTKLFGAVKHVRQKTVEWRLVRYLALGSLPGALISIFALRFLKDFNGEGMVAEFWLKKALAAVLIFVAIGLFYRLIRRVRIPLTADQLSFTPKRKLLVLLLGFVTGLIVGVTSVGSGALVMLFLIVFFPLPAGRLVGTDIVHGLILAAVTSVGYFFVLQNIEWATVAKLLIGSLPGVWLGSHLALKISGRTLRFALSGVLAVAGIAIYFG